VQRAGNKLRVVAQLIDADTDSHMWSSEYDRELADVFAVQADIAGQVARAVQVELTPREQASIAAIPTRSRDAYDLYLRALPLAYAVRPEEAPVRQGIAWLDQALALDPGFALAYALRSRLHDSLDWWGFERSAARRGQGQRDAQQALSLAPDLAEAHLAQAIQLYHGALDYEGAIRELEIVHRLAPGNSSVHFWMGVIYRRTGRWDDAIASFERLAALDPLNAPLLSDHAFTLLATRRYAESQRVYERIRLLDSSSSLQVFHAYNQFLQAADPEDFARVLGQVPKGDETDCHTFSYRSAALSASGRHDEALAAMEQCRSPSFVHYYFNERIPTAHFIALARWHRDRTRKPPEAAAAVAMMDAALEANPDRSALRMFLAMSLIMSGERTRALAEVERALEDGRRSRDGWSTTILLQQAAEVYASAGEVDRAFAKLEESLARPGGIHVAEIRTNPTYAPLRSDPRFEKLLAGKPL
jgi:tetratricopeptide (TPR) repeat protein